MEAVAKVKLVVVVMDCTNNICDSSFTKQVGERDHVWSKVTVHAITGTPVPIVTFPAESFPPVSIAGVPAPHEETIGFVPEKFMWLFDWKVILLAPTPRMVNAASPEVVDIVFTHSFPRLFCKGGIPTPTCPTCEVSIERIGVPVPMVNTSAVESGIVVVESWPKVTLVPFILILLVEA